MLSNTYVNLSNETIMLCVDIDDEIFSRLSAKLIEKLYDEGVVENDSIKSFSSYGSVVNTHLSRLTENDDSAEVVLDVLMSASTNLNAVSGDIQDSLCACVKVIVCNLALTIVNNEVDLDDCDDADVEGVATVVDFNRTFMIDIDLDDDISIRDVLKSMSICSELA